MRYLIDFYVVKEGKYILIDANVEFEGDIRYFFPLGTTIKLSNGYFYELNAFVLEVVSRNNYDCDIQSKYIKLNAILEYV